MALFKITALAFVAAVSSSPLFGPMEHHLFGIPLPHTNNPIAHNLENFLTKGLEGITGIHSVGNDKPMDMGGMKMGGGSDMGGMDMGGSSDMGGMNMGGGSSSDMSGMDMGGSSGGRLDGLLGGSGSSSAPAPSVSSKSDIDQKQLLQYLQLLQAQKQKSSDPSSDDILKYLVQNTKPAASQKTLVVKRVRGDNADDLEQQIAALLAKEGKQ